EELHSIQSRFRRTRDSIHIADGDEGRLQQMVIELRDLFDDLLGKNSQTKGSSLGITHFAQLGIGENSQTKGSSLGITHFAQLGIGAQPIGTRFQPIGTRSCINTLPCWKNCHQF
ncbi:MAG: hypothetical protein ACYDDT_08750, partial [Sulfuricella sp.]